MNSIKNMAQIAQKIKEVSDASDEDRAQTLMRNTDYLRHCSNIINDALQKGYDVLQLENGNIVTTGTKIVVNQYRWDDAKQKMVKLSAKEIRDADRMSGDIQHDNDE